MSQFAGSDLIEGVPGIRGELCPYGACLEAMLSVVPPSSPLEEEPGRYPEQGEKSQLFPKKRRLPQGDTLPLLSLPPRGKLTGTFLVSYQ